MGRGGGENGDGQDLLYGRRHRAIRNRRALEAPEKWRNYLLRCEIALRDPEYLEGEAETILPANEMIFGDSERLLEKLFFDHPERIPGTRVTGRDRGEKERGGSLVIYYLLAWIEVSDPSALVSYAQQRYEASWGDPEWEPEDIGQALEEAYVSSNNLPSPDLMGYEIRHTTVKPVEKSAD
jgi:hypothetical protein